MLGNVSEASEGNVGSNIPEPESRDLARHLPDQFKYHHIIEQLRDFTVNINITKHLQLSMRSADQCRK